MAEVEYKRFNVTTPSGGVLACDDTGDSRLTKKNHIIICLPGIGDLRASYRFLSPLLHSGGYRVIRADLRGLGESSSAWDDYSAKAVGSDILSIMSHVRSTLRHPDRRQFVLVGNSMACAASVWAAAEAPEQVSKIVLLGPFVRDPEMNGLTRAALRVLLGGFWGVSAWSSFFRSLFKKSPPQDLADYSKTLVSNLKQPGRHSALLKMLFASKRECEARIKDVRAPTLVVMGSQDPDFAKPEDEVTWIESNFPPGLVTPKMVTDAGHYPHVEFPEQVAQVILGHISQ